MHDNQRRSLRALDCLNFFLADVQTGVGPFIAAALIAKAWNPEQVGAFLTFGSLLGIFLQGPAGAFVDFAHSKRTLVSVGTIAVAASSVIFAFGHGFFSIALAQFLLGSVGPIIGPAVTAITLGLVGQALFDRQLGRNGSFNAAGNVFAAVLMGWIGWRFGIEAIFLTVPFLAIPVFFSLAAISGQEINYWRARGEVSEGHTQRMSLLFRDRALLAFSVAAFLFHFANAAMLPQLGEMLAQGRAREVAPFMSATVAVTQLTIAATATTVGRLSTVYGPRPLLLIGFAVLPVRGILYTLTSSIPLLISIQILDGIANSIFGVASAVLIADRVRGSGHFNLTMGGLGTFVGIGAAVSTVFAGFVTQHEGFRASFLALTAIAALAFLCLLVFVPNTNQPASAGRGTDQSTVVDTQNQEIEL